MKYSDFSEMELPQSVKNKLFRSINDKIPEEFGEELYHNKYLLLFEGFTIDCWKYVKSNNKTIQETKKELLKGWNKELGRNYDSYNLLYADWTIEPSFNYHNLFYAIYEVKA